MTKEQDGGGEARAGGGGGSWGFTATSRLAALTRAQDRILHPSQGWVEAGAGAKFPEPWLTCAGSPRLLSFQRNLSRQGADFHFSRPPPLEDTQPPPLQRSPFSSIWPPQYSQLVQRFLQ